MKDNKDEPFSEEVCLYDRYGYLDKVMSVTEGKNRIAYGCHVDGQLATVTKGKVTEGFIIQRVMVMGCLQISKKKIIILNRLPVGQHILPKKSQKNF